MDKQEAALLVKAIVEEQTVEPLRGEPMKASEAKVLFTVGVWFILKFYEKGIELVKGNDLG